MPNYTFILQFRGGTYISQFEGETVVNAAHVWAKKLELKGIAHLRKKHRKILLEGSEEDDVVGITGMKNVWCNTFLIGKHLAHLNIVRTDAK